MWWIVLSLLLLAPGEKQEDLLLKALKTEIKTEFDVLKANTPPVYYLAYRVEEEEIVYLEATLGNISADNAYRTRMVAIQVRVGTPQLDNTHEIKGSGGFDFSRYARPEQLPLEDDVSVIRRELWRLTQREFGKAVERYQKVTANETVMAKAEDQSADYTLEKPVMDIKPSKFIPIDKKQWAEIIKTVSQVFRSFPEIYKSGVYLQSERYTKYYIDSAGTILKQPGSHLRLYISASTRSNDGMPLFLHESFSGFSEKELPKEQILKETAQKLAEKLMVLKTAPAVEPYLGPAIFSPKAAAVFFHEVLGHRLEGHRQKSEKEGQTFTKKLNEKIVPAFISITDDPTQEYFQSKTLLGYYRYDDEGVKAQKTVLVENGILKGFLMSRSPIANFLASNGHGRGMIGTQPVSRQGNLIITAQATVPYAQLKEMLIEECKKQKKPYGLIFVDVSGGFTITGRSSAQAFKVIPLEVYRIYTDGRPEELVRGVDIVGTPLAALEKIQAASNDSDIFNGFCGAESGYIPVSAVAPAVLVEEIEVEKKEKDMEKPPILSSPLSGGEK